MSAKLNLPSEFYQIVTVECVIKGCGLMKFMNSKDNIMSVCMPQPLITMLLGSKTETMLVKQQ